MASSAQGSQAVPTTSDNLHHPREHRNAAPIDAPGSEGDSGITRAQLAALVSLPTSEVLAEQNRDIVIRLYLAERRSLACICTVAGDSRS
jgi:hypothetical protein